MEIRLHPLVVMNLSDHSIRNSEIVGILLGTIQERNIMIVNSFEVMNTPEMVEYAREKAKQCIYY